jgi:hypothetical protein
MADEAIAPQRQLIGLGRLGQGKPWLISYPGPLCQLSGKLG